MIHYITKTTKIQYDNISLPYLVDPEFDVLTRFVPVIGRPRVTNQGKREEECQCAQAQSHDGRR